MLYENKLIERSIIEMGFSEFTEIQENTIPLIKAGHDVIGHSQTGTGKTAAFAIPILESLNTDNKSVQAVVLCPTRELAVQVKDAFVTLGKYIRGLSVLAVYGGEPIGTQLRGLKRNPQVIVGTPGRTIDHLNRGTLKLDQIKILVLDEADEMLNMGFKEDIETILKTTNQDRQTVLFSATMPKPIVTLSKQYMKLPKHITINVNEKTNKDIEQFRYDVKPTNKTEALSRLLRVHNPQLSLVFCNTKRAVDQVSEDLQKRGLNVDKIHGELAQSARLHVLNKFHDGRLDVLVATDVAARGLDIKNVEAVFNYDVPDKPDYYVHRIGRTGRIGRKGQAFMLVSKTDLRKLDAILAFTKVSLKTSKVPTLQEVDAMASERQREDMQTLIQDSKHLDYKALATQMAQENNPIDVISVLLSKVAKNTASNDQGDINEIHTQKRFEFKSDKRPRKDDKDMIRYHLNLGREHGFSPKKLAAFITEKTKIYDRFINDISVRDGFSFFSVSPRDTDAIERNMGNIRYEGKQASVRRANDDLRPRFN